MSRTTKRMIEGSEGQGRRNKREGRKGWMVAIVERWKHNSLRVATNPYGLATTWAAHKRESKRLAATARLTRDGHWATGRFTPGRGPTQGTSVLAVRSLCGVVPPMMAQRCSGATRAWRLVWSRYLVVAIGSSPGAPPFSRRNFLFFLCGRFESSSIKVILPFPFAPIGPA